MPAPLAHENERAAVRPIKIEQRQARGVRFAFTFVEVVLPQCEHVTVLPAISYSQSSSYPRLKPSKKPIVAPFAHIAVLAVF